MDLRLPADDVGDAVVMVTRKMCSRPNVEDGLVVVAHALGDVVHPHSSWVVERDDVIDDDGDEVHLSLG